MYKKRGRINFKAIPRTKSGQITVFLILGLLILFIFIFVFSLSTGVKKGQLQEIQEKTLSKAFKKEALRIFVEDCLTDELEEGLVLIGRQGRLWSDQPGGTRNFEEGISGVTVGNDRLFYGIIRDPYFEYENAYPCGNESSPDEFCQYSYPNTKVGFGSLELRTSTIQNDLRRYLLNKTVSCVSEYIKGDVSDKARLESQEVAMDLAIHDTGIEAKVNYPLKLSLGNEEFFHLSQFDFFYPTRFKTLLDTAVNFPLRMDWQYIDFNYTDKTLQNAIFTYGNEQNIQNANCLPFKNYFFCQLALFSEQYASLGVEMSRQPLPNGDDVFIFKSPSVLNTPELYTYQFARQNRPPALDYLHRLECPAAGYDYLVIKDDHELGIINLTLFSLDPDEDAVNYFVQDEKNQITQGESYVRKNLQEQKDPYDLYAYAADEHNARDWQKVRVLVDRPIELGVSLSMPFQFSASGGELKSYSGENGIFPINGAYLVSKEDPSFLKVMFPEKSYIQPSLYSQEIRLTYTNKDEKGTENFDYRIPEGLQMEENQGCFSFPGGSSKAKDCTLTGYKDDILNMDKLYSPNSAFPNFREATDKGQLNLSFNAQYCARFEEVKSQAIKVVVNDCVPHRNPEHPWAYSASGNHQYVYSSFNFETLQGECVQDENGKCIKEEINPFEATHSCCIGIADNPNDWQIADENYPKPCFINPEPGCYGQVQSKKFPGTPYTSLAAGYVLEVQQQFCSGNRGNVCDGAFRNEFKDEKLICGTPGRNSCSQDIEPRCAGIFAFGYSGEGADAGWCYGAFGCSGFCQEPVAYTGSSTQEKIFDINAIALKEEALDEKDISFSCGCTTEGQICDRNFDGKFNGICQADLSCSENA